MTAIDQSPTPVSSSVAAIAAVLALGLAGSVSTVALAGGVVGLAVLFAGLVRASDALVSGGAFVLVLACFVAGALGASPAVVLAGTAASVLAWDTARTGIVLGRQLGRDAGTRRVELLHSAASAGVATLTGGLGISVYRIGAGGQPMTALVFALVAGLLLVWVLTN